MVVARHHVVVEAGQRQARVPARPQRGVGVLVDGRREHHAAVLLGVRRDVRAAAAQRDPERRARAEIRGRPHEPNLRSARSQSSGVPMSKNSPSTSWPSSRPAPASAGSTSRSSENACGGSARRRAGHVPPQLGREGVQAAVHPGRAAVRRVLLDEARHHAAGAGLDAAAPGGVGDAEQRHRAERPGLPARPLERPGVAERQRVAVGHDARAGDVRLGQQQRAAGAERLRLHRVLERTPSAAPSPSASRTAAAPWPTHSTASRTPAAASHSSCRARNGRPPSGASGLGRSPKRGRSRVPSPPARIRAFTRARPGCSGGAPGSRSAPACGRSSRPAGP